MSQAALVNMSPNTLLALRGALLKRGDLDTVFVLRDAGYAGGGQAFSAFEDFVRRESPLFNPLSLPISKFFEMAGRFFTEAGWGNVTFTSKDDAFCLIEIDNCWEAETNNQPEPAGCHLTLGYLAAFLGNFADYPVSLLEISGPSTGSERCQILAGNTQRISEYYQDRLEEQETLNPS